MKLSEFIDWTLIVFLALVILLNAGCGDSGNGENPRDHFATSPKGISVRSYQPITPQLLVACDAAIDEVIAAARANGLNDTRSHRAVSILIKPRVPECEDPAILLEYDCSRNVPGCWEYDGSQWDKDPRPGFVKLCAAGHYDEFQDLITVMPESITQTRGLYNEGEHWISFHANRQLYERTKFHNPDPHPIFRVTE